jgi:hypothetical protein
MVGVCSGPGVEWQVVGQPHPDVAVELDYRVGAPIAEVLVAFQHVGP